MTTPRAPPSNGFYLAAAYKGAFGAFNWMVDWNALGESGALSGVGGRNPLPSSSVAEPIRVGATINGRDLSLTWSGGAGPFVVQMKIQLSDVEWTDLVTLTNQTSTSLTIQSQNAFFRIVERVSSP